MNWIKNTTVPQLEVHYLQLKVIKTFHYLFLVYNSLHYYIWLKHHTCLLILN